MTALLLGAPGPTGAGSFSIDPVRIVLSEARPSAVVRVENRGETSITVQLQAMSWSQSDNHDALATSRELLATPQIFRLRPAEMQLVRVALLRPVDDRRELAYRLLLDEIPPAPSPDFRGLQMALRISMPVFVQPREAAVAMLVAAVVERDGQRQLQLINRGQAHLQLTGLTLQSLEWPEPSAASAASAPPRATTNPTLSPDSTAQTLYVHDKTIYLLPGQQRELALPAASVLPKGASLSLRAQTPGGAQHWVLPPTGF